MYTKLSGLNIHVKLSINIYIIVKEPIYKNREQLYYNKVNRIKSVNLK